jgi:hypothetical protein
MVVASGTDNMTAKKPDEVERARLKKRAEKAMSKRKQPSPSQKRSESIKKKLRNKDGKNCPQDFVEPKVLKDGS